MESFMEEFHNSLDDGYIPIQGLGTRLHNIRNLSLEKCMFLKTLKNVLQINNVEIIRPSISGGQIDPNIKSMNAGISVGWTLVWKDWYSVPII